ncbi:hypothetical protein AJ80_09617 [Polytolypa hystricis UAMH7299]|uniref:Uncharacterized protein n=1 Tax=Polytolypa hystricis (strain UAMH7299) TaxID=1447883 RepID=A0A2B7WMQ2_POLH7|nr:hypothetical protein AJ80_09617 [Polytolypa hystricis UAMH7299]
MSQCERNFSLPSQYSTYSARQMDMALPPRSSPDSLSHQRLDFPTETYQPYSQYTPYSPSYTSYSPTYQPSNASSYSQRRARFDSQIQITPPEPPAKPKRFYAALQEDAARSTTSFSSPVSISNSPITSLPSPTTPRNNFNHSGSANMSKVTLPHANASSFSVSSSATLPNSDEHTGHPARSRTFFGLFESRKERAVLKRAKPSHGLEKKRRTSIFSSMGRFARRNSGHD